MANANTYETLFILDSNHYARDPGGVAKLLETLVTEQGGEVLVNRVWMEQKLAYPIDHHQKGTYWLTYFSMDGPKLADLNRAFQLAEPVIRFLTIKLDARLVEPILAHARGESLGSPDGEATPAGEAMGETADSAEPVAAGLEE